MVYTCVFWLKSFPQKDGVHATIIPRTIMTGQKITYDKHCKVEFQHMYKFMKITTTSMEPRTSGAISLDHLEISKRDIIFSVYIMEREH